jgi:subtilase family serine protease
MFSLKEGEVMIRKLRVSSLTIIAVVSFLSTLGHAQSFMTHHVREAILSGEARSVGRLPANQSLRLVLGLPLRHEPELENFLAQLYDPTSPSYRHFLTVEEFTERFGPSQSDYDDVIRFAKAQGFNVVGTSRNRMTVDIVGSVRTIESAFHITMGVYQHPTENRTFYGPDREPTVDLPFPLWHISGLDNYSIPRPLVKRASKPKSNATIGSGPGASFLGSDMRAAYYGGTTLTGSGQSLGLLEYYGTDLADLKTYYKNVGQTESVPITLTSVDGTPTTCVFPSCDDTEQTLDMTQALGMAPGMASLVMYIGSTDTAIFNAMATASPLNAQLSCSWYWSPADPTALNPIFQEFASQGQNLFDAAGDHESWQIGGSIWPADNAYLTSVGGTDLETKSAGGPWASETAWSDSGGGVSPNSVPIPSWQVATADQCIDACSKTLRNGPDVSANSNFTFYVCADQEACTENVYGGTSFAAPMWAGYLALANQQAVANGESTLGFINPALYTIGLGSNYTSDFHDITSGSNGYKATTGYDLVTGWGSPNGANLINALVGPAGPSFTLSASPSTLSVAQGSSGTSTITVTPVDGFSGSVTLAASGLPSGVTAGFSPNPTSSTSTLTLTVGASAATGTSTITVTGTSGSLSSQTTVQLTVTANGPVVSLSPTSLKWSKIAVGTTASAKSVTLTNTGSTTLSISSIATTGDFSYVIPKKGGCGSTVNAGASCTVHVKFTPTQTGVRTGQLLFTDNAPGSPQSVALSGTGK